VDRAGHGGDGRLGYAAAVWKTLVRKAAPFLLGRGAVFQIVRRERSGGAIAQRYFCLARYSRAGLACVSRLWSRNRALAAALLPTTVGMIGFSHAASTDMPFSAMLAIAMVCAAVALGLTRNENSPVIPQPPWLALVLFRFFSWARGPCERPRGHHSRSGSVFFWALFTKRWRDAFRLFHPAALASFFATALPWYVLCARRNPDFFRIFIIEHNFKRYLTPEFQHIQPFWYYVPVLLIALAPWIPWVISFSTAQACFSQWWRGPCR